MLPMRVAPPRGADVYAHDRPDSLLSAFPNRGPDLAPVKDRANGPFHPKTGGRATERTEHAAAASPDRSDVRAVFGAREAVHDDDPAHASPSIWSTTPTGRDRARWIVTAAGGR